MSQVKAARNTVAALKRSALLAVGLLVALCATSVATSIVAMRASVSVTGLAVLSNEQRQIWTEIGRLVLYRPPPQPDKSVELSLLTDLRTDIAHLLKRSIAVEKEINDSIDIPLVLVLLFHEASDWTRVRANANINIGLQRKFDALTGYPDDLLELGIETWGSDMQVPIVSGTYLTPLNWLSDHTAALAAAVQRRTTFGLAAINLLLIAGSILGWRTILVPTYRQWAQGQMELLQTTEQVMERNAQFQGAFRAITDAACLLGDNGRILAVNFEFARLFKVSASDATQCFIQNIIDQASDKDADSIKPCASDARHPPADQDLVAIFDGRTIQLADQSIIVVRLSKAGPDSWLFLAHIQGNAERSLTKKMHDEHLRELGVYTAGVAHDLGNILATISGRLQVLRALPATPDNISEFANKLDATVSRGSALVADLLKFSRSSSLQPVLLTAAQLAQDCVELAAGKNVTFRVVRTDDFVLHVDRLQLVSAIENICKNSLDAIGAKPGALTIELRRARSKNIENKAGYACVIIEDTGGGFSQAALERACDPFFSTKGFGQGTGLGLAIVKSFVEKSGGDIKLQNTKDGAQVEIFLPAIDTDRSALP